MKTYNTPRLEVGGGWGLGGGGEFGGVLSGLFLKLQNETTEVS